MNLHHLFLTGLLASVSLAEITVPSGSCDSEDPSSCLEEVQVIAKWDPEQFATMLSLDQPVIIRTGHPGLKWPAADKWSIEYLRQNLPDLIGVRQSTEQSDYFHYCLETSEMEDTVGFSEHCYKKKDMPAKEYFEEILSSHAQSDGSRLYYSGMLSKWGKEFAEDVEPVGPLVIPLKGQDPGDGVAYFKIYTWVGQEGAVTPLHYDILHNIHFLISGKKTFDLYGPHLARALYPFPHLHPGARASQLTVDADFSRRLDRAALGRGLRASMQPGDLLYIPPLWLIGQRFHHVKTEALSVAVNVWSDYTPSRLVDFAHIWPLDWALNFLQNREDGFEQTSYMRTFLDVLLEQVGFNLADRKDFVRDMILESRYVSATGPNTTEDPLQWDEYNPHSINELTRFCSSPEAQQEVAGEAFAFQQLLSRAMDLGRNFTRITSLAGLDRRDMYLADVIESTLGHFLQFDATRVKQFLYDFVYC